MTDRAWVLPDGRTAADLATYVARALRVDPGGAARVVGHGHVLAVYVSPVHGAGGPTVLGLRTVALSTPYEGDTVVALESLRDRFARLTPDASTPDAAEVQVPPGTMTGITWAGIAPPRSGWSAEGVLTPHQLRTAARAGAEEITTGSPEGSGAVAVAHLRARVWGRPLTEGEADGPIAGAAFVADALGFLGVEGPVGVHRAGPWWRLTTGNGHVLQRSAGPTLL